MGTTPFKSLSHALGHSGVHVGGGKGLREGVILKICGEVVVPSKGDRGKVKTPTRKSAYGAPGDLGRAGVEKPFDGAQYGRRRAESVRFRDFDFAFVKKLVPKPGEFVQLLTVVF